MNSDIRFADQRRNVIGALFFTVTCFATSSTYGAAVVDRQEIVHQGQSSELHLSHPAIAVSADGKVHIAWVAEEGNSRNVRLAVDASPEAQSVRVNPDSLAAISLHASPSLAVSSDGVVYVAWGGIRRSTDSESKPALYLSRSRDGGRSFDRHIEVGNDRVRNPMFEGLAIGSDGQVSVGGLAWGATPSGPGIWLLQSDSGLGSWSSTLVDTAACPCCRVHMSISQDGTLGMVWRKVFPGNVRDMVVSYLRAGESTTTAPRLIHDDGWVLDACPHRGGQMTLSATGHETVAWYTEGKDEKPQVLTSSTTADASVMAPVRLNQDNGWIPDDIGLAIDRSGDVGVIWKEATAARSRVVISINQSSPVVLTSTLKATAPVIVAAPDSGWIAVWREDSWPVLKTVIARIQD